MRRTILFLGCLTILLSAVTARATVIYEQYSNTPYSGNNPFAYSNYVAEDFTVSGSFALNKLTFNAYTQGDTTPNTGVNVKIYTNNNGTIGNLLYSQNITGLFSGTTTNPSYQGYVLKDYTIDLPVFNISAGNYYLALNVTPTQWNMHWSIPSGSQIGSASYISSDGGATYHAYNFEHEFRLEGDSAPVPEPGTMALLGFGLAGLAVYGKRRKNNLA